MLYESIAYRAGFLSLAQVPLIFLLAGKENLVGFFTGYGYDRLHWLHRWVARCLLLTTTIHLAYWLSDWLPYHYFRNDQTTRTGLSAWALLIFIVITTLRPIRNRRFELFFPFHLMSFIAFMVMILIHTPASDHAWIWVGVGIYAFDRVLRFAYMAYKNLAIFHSKLNSNRSWGAYQAQLTALPHSVTRLAIQDVPFSWKPGQFVLLSLPSVAPLQSHPFSVSSIPSDGKLEILIQSHNGVTRKIHEFARNNAVLPNADNIIGKISVPAVIQGPYGTMRPLHQFDSIVLFSGSVGASFTVPLLRDIIHRWKTSFDSPAENDQRSLVSLRGIPTRSVRFVWIVKSDEQLCWFSRELWDAMDDVKVLKSRGLNVRLDASVYVTCDRIFTSDWNASKRSSASQKGPGASRFVENWHGKPSSGPDEDVEIIKLDEDPEKKMATDAKQNVAVKEVDPRSELNSEVSNSDASGGGAKAKACQPDGTCCCKTTIKNETRDAVSADAVCTCNNCCYRISDPSAPVDSSDPPSTPEGDDSAKVPNKLELHPSIALLSGRPHPKTIIRRVLERADGESAVVSCGPPGLNDDVRRTVVSLSDERAVSKGTGACGVWFWGEGYGL